MEKADDSLDGILMNKNYQSKFILEASDRFIYESILKVPLWWTEMFEGSSDRQGDRFTVRFGPSVYKTMLVETLDPYKRITWKVVDSLIDLPQLEKKTEWIDTLITWEIEPHESTTVLTLTHKGLTPLIECYSICKDGWQGFTNSLIHLIKTGVGKPFRETS